jgi:hypothetical protein
VGCPETSQNDCLTPNQLPNKRLLPLAELNRVSETQPLETSRYSQNRKSESSLKYACDSHGCGEELLVLVTLAQNYLEFL